MLREEDGLIGDPFEHILRKQKKNKLNDFTTVNASHYTDIFASFFPYLVEKILFLNHLFEIKIFGDL